MNPKRVMNRTDICRRCTKLIRWYDADLANDSPRAPYSRPHELRPRFSMCAACAALNYRIVPTAAFAGCTNRGRVESIAD